MQGLEYTNGKWNALWDAQYVSRRQSVDDITGQYGSSIATLSRM